jgi:hypothetical protein
MENILYTSTTSETLREDQIITFAQTLGYSMTKFCGWTDTECADRRVPGSRIDEVRENQSTIKTVTSALAARYPETYTSIFHVEAPSEN